MQPGPGHIISYQIGKLKLHLIIRKRFFKLNRVNNQGWHRQWSIIQCMLHILLDHNKWRLPVVKVDIQVNRVSLDNIHSLNTDLSLAKTKRSDKVHIRLKLGQIPLLSKTGFNQFGLVFIRDHSCSS